MTITIAILTKLAGYGLPKRWLIGPNFATTNCTADLRTESARMPHHITQSRILGWAVDVGDIERVAQAALALPPNGDVLERCSIVVAINGKTIRGTIPRGQT